MDILKGEIAPIGVCDNNLLKTAYMYIDYKDNLKVGNITVNHFKILDKLKMIVKDNLVQLLDILKNMPNIQNAKNYLMICLYNNLGNININKMIKKADIIKPNERDYPAGSLDFLYANFNMPITI